MNKIETVIFEILRDHECYGRENMMTPSELFEKCKEKGLGDIKTIERATVSLIDMDVIEYEMDDNLNTTELWLIESDR